MVLYVVDSRKQHSPRSNPPGGDHRARFARSDGAGSQIDQMLLDQDDQHLIDLLAALTGEKARDVRTWLNTGGDEALLTSLVKGTA